MARVFQKSVDAKLPGERLDRSSGFGYKWELIQTMFYSNIFYFIGGLLCIW